MAIIVLLYLLFIIFLRRFLQKERWKDLLKHETTVRRKPPRDQTDEEKAKEKGLRGDAIALGSVIVSMIALAAPFIQNPLVDYNVDRLDNTSKQGFEQYKVEVNNLGSETAKDVVLSLKAHDVTFVKFTSDPVLSENSTKIKNETGNAFFDLESLPPRAQTFVTVDLDASENPDGILTTFIRGDDTVGYHGSVPTVIIYSIYVGTLVYVSITTIKESLWRWWHNYMIIAGAISVLVLIFFLVAGLL